ncbi:uncharacterized protein E0L32_000199 [Thyridium curvatum]|uniref:Small secreted protein n=1 Tax=Thyridium curvatum TaxID=1093900 RepID=A0A507AYI2_9PEZI|nr:uncharacterized protein E0L32_000199 [Thyridium curvatum]TPX15865.1 hypothetical protein E0L32_000199 [Thyridium curvatum]
MQIFSLVLAAFALVISSVLSAPLPSPNPEVQVVSMLATVPQWTIKSMKRSCNGNFTRCIWFFSIDTQAGAPVQCRLNVVGTTKVPATQTAINGARCGGYVVSTGWSGQFGPGNGFTTLSIVDVGNKLIAWPAYADGDLVNKVTVRPDRSFPVTKLQT